MIAGTHLILTRHGQTYLNALVAANAMQSRHDWEAQNALKQLNATGIKQARKLGERLRTAAWLPQKVITSLSDRTIETAKHIIHELGCNNVQTVQTELLRETVSQQYMDAHIPGHSFNDIPGYQEEFGRARQFFREHVLSRRQDWPILVVAHEIRNVLLLDCLCGTRTSITIEHVNFPNCAIAVIRFDERLKATVETLW